MKNSVKKTLNIILTVLLVIFIVLSVLAVTVTLIGKKSDGTISVFHRQMRIVVSPSMEKCDQVDVSQYKIKDIPVKSMVFIQEVPEDAQKAEEWYANLQVGDVLTFQYMYASTYIITHRIVEISPNANGGYTIVLQGDNRESNVNAGKQILDTSKDTAEKGSLNYIIGKVTGKSYALGVLVTGLQKPLGMALFVIVPCTIIIVIQVIKIVETMRAEKVKAQHEQQQKQADEIEELKKQIAALQQSGTSQNNEPDGGVDDLDADTPTQE